MLQPLYGGALARPFTTHHNALDRDLYLRIATELYLKRLIVGGIERVYELGKDFRNEGISPKHNPEFTMLEWYEAYADYKDAAERLEQLVASVAESAFGGTKVERDGDEIDLSPPWQRITLRDAIKERTGHRPRSSARAARSLPPRSAASRSRRRAGASSSTELLSKLVEPTLIQPDVHPRLPGGALAVREAPPLRRGLRRAVGGVRRRGRDRERVHRAQRPRRAAPPLRAAGARSFGAATRTPSRSTRPSSRRSSRGCRRPAASAWASTGW